MKKIAAQVLFLAVTILSLQAQKVSNYVYHLTNGINVKTEKCWNNVWIDQKFEPVKSSDQAPPLTLNVRTLGDFSAGSSFKLYTGGKEIKVQGAKPGTYTLKMTYKLSGKPGTLTFNIDNVEIKAGNRTVLSVTLYEYQVIIDESPGTLKGLTSYESNIFRFKGNSDQTLNRGVPSFYLKGSHDKAIPPDEKTNDLSGKVKPGTYDVLISIECALRTQKVWLENFTLKPDVSYKITINMNGGLITYSGGNKEVKAIHLYPYGTSARLTGTPAPDKNSEIIKYENPTNSYFCPPGSYDVLLNFGNGARYEWRKNIIVTTGSRTNVK
jgi:hypothetical protein